MKRLAILIIAVVLLCAVCSSLYAQEFWWTKADGLKVGTRTNGYTKFYIDPYTGNATGAGTLAITGAFTLTGLLNANGGLAVDTNKFTVSGTTYALATTPTATTTDMWTLNANTLTTGDAIQIACDDDALNGGNYLNLLGGASADTSVFKIGESGLITLGDGGTIDGMSGTDVLNLTETTVKATGNLETTGTLDVQGGNITLQNDETIGNSVNGTVDVTAGVFKHAFDANDYWTATITDGNMVTFDNATSGTAGFTFSDALTLNGASTILKDAGTLQSGLTSGTILTSMLLTPKASTATGSINYHKLFAVGDVTGNTAFGFGDVTKPTTGVMGCFGREAAVATSAFTGTDTGADFRAINKAANDAAYNIQGAYIKAKNYEGGVVGTIKGLYVEVAQAGTATASYGIDIGTDGTTPTADIRLHNGATISENTDGQVVVGGLLSATGTITATDATDSVTVSATHYGRTIFLTHADTVAVALPQTAPAAGTECTFVLNGDDSLAVTFDVAGADDNLIAPNNASADSVTFGAGHRIGAVVKFISNGTSWIAVNVNAGCTMTVTDGA
jgi:hypothetical protein